MFIVNEIACDSSLKSLKTSSDHSAPKVRMNYFCVKRYETIYIIKNN